MKHIFIFISLFFLFILQIFFLNNLPILKYLNLILVFIFFFLQSGIDQPKIKGKEKIFLSLGVAVLGAFIMEFSSLFFPGTFFLTLVLLCFIFSKLARKLNLDCFTGLLLFSFLGIVFYQILLLSLNNLFFFLGFSKIYQNLNLSYWLNFFYFIIVNLFTCLFFFYGSRSYQKFFKKRN